MRAIDINSFFASIASITNSNKGDISVQRGGIVGGGIQIDYFFLVFWFQASILLFLSFRGVVFITSMKKAGCIENSIFRRL